MKLLWTWGSLAILAAQGFAQDALPPAPADSAATISEPASAPFAAAAPKESDLDNALSLSESGQNALKIGFDTEAVSSFKQALALPNLDATTKDSLNLDLVTAFLAEGQLDQATAALQSVADTNTPAYLLRAALLQSRQAHWDGADGAAATVARIDSSKLSEIDSPWYFAVQARLAEYHGDADAAKAAWQQAIDHAPPLSRGQFEAALGRSQTLLSKSPTPDEAEKLRVEMAAATLPALGAQFASQYAIMLDRLGRRDEAIKVVEDWVKKTDLDPKSRDTLRLAKVYLDSEGTPSDAGEQANDRQALEDILQEHIDINSPDLDSIRQMQEQALGLLQQQTLTPAAGATPSAADVADLKKFIDGIIADPDPDSHPQLKLLYLFQANLALTLKQYDAAQAAASHLLEKFPPGAGHDALIDDAQMVLAEVYWHDGQYRVAANYLLNIYNDLPPGVERSSVARLLADIYYTKGDFRNAAEFYANLLTDVNSPMNHGEVLFLAVDSELRAQQINDALKLMENGTLRTDDPEDRWQAEWILLTALRDNNRSKDAYQRLNRLLDPIYGANLLDTKLLLQFRWLYASLAVSLSDTQALNLVDVFQKEVESLEAETIPGNTSDERAKLAKFLADLDANALLLRGEAEVQANPADAADQAKLLDEQHQTFEILRQKYPGTDPALNSYFDEASELDVQNKTVEAQRLMNIITDQFPKSDKAPEALYSSALYSTKLGKTEEALNLLQKFVETYRADPAQQLLLYKVRLQYASLEAHLSTQASLESARDIFDVLIKNPNNPANPNDPWTAQAKVGRAECLYDLATLPNADPQRRQDAIDEVKVLYNQTSLPVDDRVELGWMWGNLVEYSSNADADAAAQEVYWRVYNDFWLNDQSRAELDHTPDGRSLMVRCLTALKQIKKSQNNDTEVNRIDGIIADFGLAPAAVPVSPAATTTPAN